MWSRDYVTSHAPKDGFHDKRSVERSEWDSKQPINIMDSDDSNISDHVGDLDIQPYQFEPLCNDESQQEREYSTSEDSDIDESSQSQDRLVNTNWWGFVYLLTILKKTTIERKTEITGCTDDDILTPPPSQFTKVLTNKDDCRCGSYVPLF